MELPKRKIQRLHLEYEFSSFIKMNKTHTSNDVWVLLAQKERLDKALPCLCFATSYYMSVLLRLRRTVAHGLRVLVSHKNE